MKIYIYNVKYTKYSDERKKGRKKKLKGLAVLVWVKKEKRKNDH